MLAVMQLSCGKLTVVGVDEVRGFRGVVDQLDLADLPHLFAFVPELLQHAETQHSIRPGRTLYPPNCWHQLDHICSLFLIYIRIR